MVADPSNDRQQTLPAWALNILQCPITQQTLTVAEPEVVESVRQTLRSGTLSNASGGTVEIDFDSGLVNQSETYFFPMSDGIPTLIPGEAISLATLRDQ